MEMEWKCVFSTFFASEDTLNQKVIIMFFFFLQAIHKAAVFANSKTPLTAVENKWTGGETTERLLGHQNTN